MEPAGWVIDTVGTRHEDPAAGNGRGASRQPLPSDPVSSPRNGRSASTSQTADAAAADDDRGGDSSHNSVDDLLRRIARDVSARQAPEGKSKGRKGDDRGIRDHESGGRADRDGRHHERRQQERRPGQEHQPSQDPTRKSRWSTTSEQRHSSSRGEYGGSSRVPGGGARGDGADRDRTHFGAAAAEEAAAAENASVAEENPFTEGMWEDSSCRQVLQAMFFSPGSALPAGSTEEYKELEGMSYAYYCST